MVWTRSINLVLVLLIAIAGMLLGVQLTQVIEPTILSVILTAIMAVILVYLVLTNSMLPMEAS